MNKLISIILSVAISPLAHAAFDCSTVTEIPSVECEALVALYNSTNGENWWTNWWWLETSAPCSWYKVTCSGGHVSEIKLHNNQLTGSIPSELGNLSNLTTLDLDNNSLTGTIPSEIGNLTQLTSLYLNYNQLTGTIPNEIGNLTNLGELWLYSNQLTGTIPSEIGNLTNLTWLELGNNQLTGTIPSEIGNLTNLTWLELGNNQLTGTIPSEIGNLTNLWSLLLDNNQLCGEIPSELKNLSNIPLPNNNNNCSEGICLKLDNNHLIPPNVGTTNSELITWLNAHNPGWDETQTPCNQAQSKLQFTSATYSVVENEGQATITVTRTNGSDEAISVDYATTDDTATAPNDYTATSGTLNWANGDAADKTFTVEIIDNDKLENNKTLIVSLNNATGAILGSPNTVVLTIKDKIEDKLDCTKVTEIPPAECEALVALYNSADGPNWPFYQYSPFDNRVPLGWNTTLTPCSWYGVTCDDGHVTGLDLASDKPYRICLSEQKQCFSTCEISGCMHCYDMDNICDNIEYSLKLIGTIPAELGNLNQLRYLNLSGNQLTSTIPSELGNLNNLTLLSLPWNQLTGTIPNELGNLSKLETLRLSSNELTGTIPTELGKLTNLLVLWLDENNLTGSIPTELGNLSKLTEFYLYSNQLCGEIPVELKNLSNISLHGECIYNTCLKIDNNHLTASDSELIEWLNTHNPGWETTQTSCPPQILLEKDNYNPGELFQARLTEELALGYELYAAIVMQDGNFLALKNTNEFATLNTVAKWDGQRIAHTPIMLLDLILPDNLPSGEYCLYGILSPRNKSVLESVDLWVWTQQCLFLN